MALPLCRNMGASGLTGTIPSQIGLLTALTELCVPPLPHISRRPKVPPQHPHNTRQGTVLTTPLCSNTMPLSACPCLIACRRNTRGRSWAVTRFPSLALQQTHGGLGNSCSGLAHLLLEEISTSAPAAAAELDCSADRGSRRRGRVVQSDAKQRPGGPHPH